MSDVVREIANLIESSSGFVIGRQNLGVLASFIEQRVERGGFAGVERYADYLRRHPDSEEWRHLLSKITIKESYLFRAQAQFDALSKVILDEIGRRSTEQQLRVWCAGCARGEEAATLAIVLADHAVVGGWRWSVLATDVDDAALADARRGVYGPRAVERVPPATLAEHFVRRRDGYELEPTLRERIEYRRLNLIDQLLDLGGERFEVVFLRNVLIYFRPELQRRVVDNVERTLAPGGSLFLGPSESLLHLGSILQARDLGECFCYQRPHTTAPGTELKGQVFADTTLGAETPGDGVMPSTMPAAERVDMVSFDRRVESVVEALERGLNQRAAAGAAALRHENPESAMVHALEGIAFERIGEADRAVLAYRAALYLAPEMDEVRFLLARALDRLGRTRAAAREYRTALTGLGPASDLFPATVLDRLELPDHVQMTEICLDYIRDK